ncbi:MAG: YggT family protein [Rickettsiales bacterium]|nr:YggT family protein [Rickettsiales bacterium]
MININPFINLVSSILSIYSFLLFVYIIMYYLSHFNVINRYSPVVVQINRFLVGLIEPVLRKLRVYIPSVAGIDLSMIALFLLIHFTQDSLYTYFYTH